jgi:hypothetical protein
MIGNYYSDNFPSIQQNFYLKNQFLAHKSLYRHAVLFGTGVN